MSNSAPVSIELLHDSAVNYAMQQNAVPVVRRLRLTNAGDEDLADLTVEVASEPAFAETWRTLVALLRAGETLDLGAVDLRLSGTYLAGLNERVSGALTVTVQQAETEVCREVFPTALLAYDEWNGLQTAPNIIAAFVTPNHPEIARLLREAAGILAEWSENPSLDGYQSKDPNRARLQMAAIYTAMQRMEIAYCVAPASFEERGQKVRTPDVIRETRLGNCLDLTALFAACCEAAGLHPIVVFTEGHAFAGAWLVEDTFPEDIQDDLTLLTKRIAPGVNEMCLVEATALTAGQDCPFLSAVTAGEAHLREPDRFHFFVDIKRARASGIRPLPSRVSGRPVAEPEAPAHAAAAPHFVDDLVTVTPAEEAAADERTRLDGWKRRLLDLGLRNPLLNFRLTGASLPFIAPELHDLEDALADGKDFQVLPRPGDWTATPRDAAVYRRRANSDPQRDLIRAEFGQGRLRADLTEADLTKRLTALYRSARTSIEENGANTLYLALGLLVWHESAQSQKPRYAPILLIPMEIVRKSVRSGYALRKRDDDPVLNITLLEMLKQDHGIEAPGLSELPRDEHGVDVRTVFTRIRQAVMNQTRWDVLEDAYLGLFTFSKFVMWRDLDARSEELKRNALVAGLMDGAATASDGHTFPDPERLDQEYTPQEVFCPTGADAHQLSAIVAAGKGKTFILHGPPGTGKSHTITNIIAHALANGKSVLFVAEKMAALTVVQRNLARIGLDPFCLEVHSNKSKKATVLRQLGRALEKGQAAHPEGWQAEAERLAALRIELNAYVEALHRPRGIGHSVFQGLARFAAVRSAPEAVRFDIAAVAGLTPEALRQWDDMVRDLYVAGSECGRLLDHPWALARREEYTPSLRGQVADALTALRSAVEGWRQTAAEVAALFQVPGTEASYAEGKALRDLARHFLSAPAMPGAMVRAADWGAMEAAVQEWVAHGRARDALRAELSPRYTERALALDLGGLRESLRAADAAWFLPRWLGRRKVAKALSTAVQPGQAPDAGAFDAELDALEKWSAEERVLREAGDRAREALGRLWNDGDADWNAVAAASAWAADARRHAAAFAGTDLGRLESLREHWARMLNEYAGELGPDGSIGRKLSAFTEAGDALVRAWQGLSQLLSMEDSALAPDPAAPGWLDALTQRVDRWQNALDDLRDWCAWIRVRGRAEVAGLLPVITPYEQGGLKHEEVAPAFQRGLYQTWSANEIENDPVLAQFSRGLFEDRIRQFRDLDARFADLTKREVFARLAGRVPHIRGSVSPNAETGILMNQLQRQRGHMALREVFQKIPNLLPRLAPCMLMSPMSVAQYLDPAHPPFDIVIFDEASQVPTWEAVGAIARGAQAIIVGDPKQLPPTSTSFFARTAAPDEEEAADIQDLDSILEDCKTIGVAEEHLRWHYRSRHESLIAFSNFNYYDGLLITFPSPDDQTSAVRWRYVGGTYDRGASKTNRKEAEAVADEVVRRLRDPKTAGQSLGIVTFNQAQQQLIEDLLDERMRQNPELEPLYAGGPNADERGEPVFVKNLENVQGDERDAILLSVGYGPDADGRVAMNFGPLNREGGWRRLNVIVSRARHEMLVFSSMRGDQLDLSRTNASGVADLRAFLEYAEKGKAALPAQPRVSADAACESPFEEEVCRALRERGHTVHAQVGCSNYRIDLAVVDPERPGRYVLGIECDGATYHRAKTARDRDKLREDVLNGLGWTLHRIWSTDWWENPAREVERIETALAAARERGGLATTEEPTTAPTVSSEPRHEPFAAPVSATQRAADEPPRHLLAMDAPSEPESFTVTEQRAAPAGLEDSDPRPTAPTVKTQPPPPDPATAPEPEARSVYVPCRLNILGRSQDEFYLPQSDRTVIRQIQLVVEREGPIVFPLLCRRVIQAWGMGRVGGRIEERMRTLCAGARLNASRNGKTMVYWRPDLKPEEYEGFRVPGAEPDSQRKAEELPDEEIANATRHVLRDQISLPEPDLIREVARLFGYQRTGVNVEAALRRGVRYLLKRGAARQESDSRIVGTE